MKREWRAAARKFFSGDYALGVLLIVLVSMIWAGASIVTQEVEAEGMDPYVLTYWCNAMFTLFLLPRPRPCQEAKKAVTYTTLQNGGEDAESKKDDDEDDMMTDDEEEEVEPEGWLCGRFEMWVRGRPLRTALVLSPLWVGGQAMYNLSLTTTSVTSSTILSSTSSAFTLAAGVIAGIERPQPEKVLGVLTCILGSSLVALSDEGDDQQKRSLFGDVAALLSAVSYGAYTATLKLAAPTDIAQLLGYMGVANMVFFAPPLAIYCGASGRCSQGWSPRIIGLVIVQGLFDNVLSDFLWARAVMLTSPTAATIGLSLTIPMAFATDAIQHGVAPRRMEVLGALCVVVGFIGVIWRDSTDDTQPQRTRRRPSSNGLFGKKPSKRRQSDSGDMRRSNSSHNMLRPPPPSGDTRHQEEEQKGGLNGQREEEQQPSARMMTFDTHETFS